MSEAPDLQLAWSRASRFSSIPFEDIAPKAVGYLIKGVLPLRGLGFIVGASKAGKSFIALDWLLKLACGATTVMERRAKQTGVAYIGAEDPGGLELRIHAWKLKHPRGSYTPFRLIPRGVNLLDDGEVDELIAELRDIAAVYEERGHRLGVIAFDTLSRCLPGAEENSSESMSRAVQALERIGREFDALAIAVAHHGKDGSRGIRGWSGLDAASDATVTVERDEIANTRTLTLSKVKNGKDGDVIAFSLDPVPCGIFDEDGDEAWSLVVQYEGLAEKASKKRKALSPQAEIVLSSMLRLIDREIRQAPPVGAEARQGTWAVRRSDLALEAATNGLSYGADEKANTFNVRFGRAVNELQRERRARVMGDAIWPI